jgi:hypothetical protein
MGSTSSDNQIDLFAAAHQLRAVRTACRRFLLLWGMSPVKGSAASRQNLAIVETCDDPDTLLRAISNPENKDWSILYRGDVLDD